MSVLRLKAAPELGTALQQFSSRGVATKAGDRIFREGEKSHGCYLIRAGQVKLYVGSENGERALDMRAGEGCLVGLPATINGHNYSLTCESLSDTELFYLSRQDITRLMREDTTVAIMLLDLLSSEIQTVRKEIAETPGRKRKH